MLLLNTIVFAISSLSYAEIKEDAINIFLFDTSQENSLVLLNPDGSVPPQWKQGSDVKVLVHGWNSVQGSNEVEVFVRHYLWIVAKEYAKLDRNLNIIFVDWTYYADGSVLEYWKNFDNVKPAGFDVAEYLVKLQAHGGFSDWSKLHLVAHSLGSHVSGAAGYQVSQLTGGRKIGRITACDPAGPGFYVRPGDSDDKWQMILDKSDADFVDIIHTNQGDQIFEGPIIHGRLGSNLQAGHVDFYPNGGENQQYQCTFEEDRLKLCSHQISVLFFALSINNPHVFPACNCLDWNEFFWGKCNCDNVQYMGEHLSKNARERHYLKIEMHLSKESFN